MKVIGINKSRTNSSFKSIGFAFILVLSVTFNACEDPIEVVLPEGVISIVVDAWLTNRNEVQEITLRESAPYFDRNRPSAISTAQVSIIRNGLGRMIFDHIGDGVYRWNEEGTDSLGVVGDMFDLVIEIGSETITASSRINRVPTIDSMMVQKTGSTFVREGFYAQFFARDFDGKDDAYWIKSFHNGKFLGRGSQMNLAYDAGFDSGTAIDGIIFIRPIRESINLTDSDGFREPFELGDHLRVEIHSISVPAFNFLRIVRDQINNSQNGLFAAPLANARTNLKSSNGRDLLGFFNVSGVEKYERIIQ